MVCTVQCNAAWCNAVVFSTVQYIVLSTVQCNAGWCYVVKYSVQCSTMYGVQCGVMQLGAML